MLTRRQFSALLAVSPLAGCGFLDLQPVRPICAPGAIDAHMHLFNGRDIPAQGFLEQVDFIGAHDGGVPPLLRSDLVRFIVAFLVASTPSATDELAALPSRAATTAALPPADRAALEAGDRARLARHIETYAEDQAAAAPMVARSARMAAPGPETDLLAAMADAAGVGPPVGMRSMARSAAAPAPDARAVADGLYDPANQAGSRQRQSIAGIIRWATMLTRPRAQILAQAIALYGGPQQVQVICNHMIDFDLWLARRETVTPVRDQVEVMARIAALEQRALVLNFVAYCPLRDAMTGGQALADVQWAVRQRGCAGVKIYPPAGFRPTGNAGISFAHGKVPGGPPGGGAAIDARLDALYRWCAEHDVPIMTHGAPSMGAGPGTAMYAEPALWAPVLERHPALRVNLGHFGGMSGPGQPDWEPGLAAALNRFPGLFVDGSFWTGTGPGQAARPAETARLRRLLAAAPGAGAQLLYGSDWSLIARDDRHNRYLADQHDFLAAATGSPAMRDAMMGGNAMRWLGLDRADGAQSRRLADAFGGNPVMARMRGTGAGAGGCGSS